MGQSLDQQSSNANCADARLPVVLGAALALAMIATLTPMFSGQASAEARGLPEIIFRKNVGTAVPDTKCLIRFQISGGDISSRRSAILSVIEEMAPNKNQRLEFPAGVDFLRYSEMYVFFNRNCEESSQDRDIIASLLGSCKAAGDCDKPITVATSKVENSWLIGSPDGNLNPSERFVSIRGRARVIDCIVSFDSASKAFHPQMGDLVRPLFELLRNYRFPIADISWTDSRFYLLFSRDCDAKRQLMAEAKQLMLRMHYDWNAFFKNVDYHPDLSPYLQPELGETTLHN